MTNDLKTQLVGLPFAALAGYIGNVLSNKIDAPGWLVLFVTISTVIWAISTWRYIEIFSYGRMTTGTTARTMFDNLKARLERGGQIGEIYEAKLTSMLNTVDRFCGDSGPNETTLWPKAFGFRGRAPFWTSPSYERCLSIALAYPIGALFLVWAIQGNVGTFEDAIGLPINLAWWERLFSLAIGLSIAIVFNLLLNIQKVKTISWALTAATLLFFLYLGTFDIFSDKLSDSIIVAMATGLTYCVVFTVLILSVRFNSGISGVYFLYGLLFLDFDIGIYSFFEDILIAIIFMGGVFVIKKFLIDSTNNHIFMIISNIVILSAVYVLSFYRMSDEWWSYSALMMLFYLVFPLVNAPFDWITLGMTRALLRRGLEMGGWWPLLLALADIIIGVFLLLILAVSLVIAINLFNASALAGGAPTAALDLAQMLDGLDDPERRSHSEYWWLYATLFSTLIPSVINIAVGTLSVIRGLPGFHKVVGRAMTPDAGVLGANLWMAPTLALEVWLSIGVGLAAPLGLLWMIFGWMLPAFGTGIIPILRAAGGLG